MSGLTPRLHAVQTSACAPLARAWQHALEHRWKARDLGVHWSECMWPWESIGDTAADGIVDDETYDWLAVCAAMGDGDGSPVVVDEQPVLDANRLLRDLEGIDASPTGSAGLAGLLVNRGDVAAGERVAFVASGVRR